jgi:hypothetical protein
MGPSLRLAGLVCIGLLGAAALPPALADEVVPIDVRFAPGTTGATYNHRIQGDNSVEYRLQAQQGQTMRIALTTDNLSNDFNVYAPGAETAMFIGSSAGKRFAGTLPADGTDRVQVYLMRNAARRDETADDRIAFEIDG